MIGLKRRRDGRADGNGKRDGMAEHRTAGHDVPSSCPTQILRRLTCRLSVHKYQNRNYCAIQIEKQ